MTVFEDLADKKWFSDFLRGPLAVRDQKIRPFPGSISIFRISTFEP